MINTILRMRAATVLGVVGTLSIAVVVPASGAVSTVDAVKLVVDQYIGRDFVELSKLQARGIDDLADQSSQGQAVASRHNDRIAVLLRVANAFNLGYVSYDYEIAYNSLTVSGASAEAYIVVDSQVVYARTAPIVTKERVSHRLALRLSGQGWRVARDETDDVLDAALADSSRSRLISNVDATQAAAATRSGEYSGEVGPSISAVPGSSMPTQSLRGGHPRHEGLTKYSYNRNAAFIYQQTWAGSFNPAYHNYSDVATGGDCTNYVSQVIHAGGAPMDTTGTSEGQKWYWFSDSNRVPSWTGVSYLYNYLIQNSSTSPGPDGNTSKYSAMQVGDVVQLSDGSTWHHSVAVDAVTRGNVGGSIQTTEIYVSAHSYPAWNVPIESYAWASARRYIQIAGYWQ